MNNLPNKTVPFQQPELRFILVLPTLTLTLVKTNLICPCILLACCLWACDNAQTHEQTLAVPAPDSLAAVAKAAPTLLGTFSGRLQRIIRTDSGLVRGFTPGTLLDSAMRRETAVLHEDSTHYKGYFLENPYNTEVFDIRYFFNANTRRTDSLVLDTYLNTVAASDSLMAELTGYFTKRFGSPATKGKKSVVWRAGSNQIVVRDVGIAQSPGLQVVARRR